MDTEDDKRGERKRAGAGRGEAKRGKPKRGVAPGGVVRGKRAERAAAIAAGAAIVARRGQRGKALGKLVGGMRRRRMFDGGEMRLVLLKLIADEPRHGYELIKAIEETAGGGYAPSPGVIYPTLTMLSDIGHVAGADDGDGRKRFTVTEAGTAELAGRAGDVEKLMARLNTVGEKHRRTDAMPVRRAMGNLKTVLQDRLGRGEASDETLLEVAKLIDEVAQKIERLG